MAPATTSSTTGRSITIGIYGVSGVGKSHALEYLKKRRPEWHCLEGSQVIRSVLNDQVDQKTFQEFCQMNDTDKNRIRDLAGQKIKQRSGVTIVAGHASFPCEETKEKGGEEEKFTTTFKDIFTQTDADTYDAILYLDKPSDVVHAQRAKDSASRNDRGSLSIDEISLWMSHEKQLLRHECTKYDIDFAVITSSSAPATAGVSSSWDDDAILSHILEKMLPKYFPGIVEQSRKALTAAVQQLPGADLYLLIDADRTLSPIDTGKQFFDAMKTPRSATMATGDDDAGKSADEDILKSIFKRYYDDKGYTFQAFWEVAMLYNNVLSLYDYHEQSKRLGESVELYKAWISFLSTKFPLQPRVCPVVVTSGNREIWKTALNRHFKSGDNISLLAGNHVQIHDYLVDSEAKGVVVKELRTLHPGCRIFSFGDSEVDIPMLEASDRAYVVIDDRRNRSLQTYLSSMANHGTTPTNGSIYQLNLMKDENGDSFVYHEGIQVTTLSKLKEDILDGSVYDMLDWSDDVAAKVLATQTRNATLSGPALQDVHSQVGRFLADRLISRYASFLVSVKSFPHVQAEKPLFEGIETIGANLAIVALMRAGEPMARGVYDRFPSARFVHYYDNGAESDNSLQETLLGDAGTSITDVIVVDSVINNGNTVRKLLEKLLNDGSGEQPLLHLRIYVVTGVMQSKAAEVLPIEYPRVRFVTLRVSNNKYTGKGGTDTGNRLFGTHKVLLE